MNAILERDEWQAARNALLAEEKLLTKAQDRLAALRRRLPREQVKKEYRFIGPHGTVELADLFEGRKQLIVYHHMLKRADPAPCPGCGLVGDQIPNIAHLNARDTSLVFASLAPFSEIDAFRRRMGWSFPWVQSIDDFNADFGVPANGPGLNVFLREGETILRTYCTTGRGMEPLGTVWTFLDITPLGRQELWEDSPSDVVRSAPYQWWRLHDEYDHSAKTANCCGS